MIIDLTAVLFLVSGLINVVLVWYIVQLLKRFLNFQAQLDGFMDKIQEYAEHVDVVYNMENFMGDPTLANLLQHSKGIAEECDGFKTFYLTETDEVQEEYAEAEDEVTYGE
jgi:hypothetical protein